LAEPGHKASLRQAVKSYRLPGSQLQLSCTKNFSDDEWRRLTRFARAGNQVT